MNISIPPHIFDILAHSFWVLLVVTAVLGVAVALGNTNNNTGNSTIETQIPINNSTPEQLPPDAILVETPPEPNTTEIIENTTTEIVPIENITEEVLVPIQEETPKTVTPAKKEETKTNITYNIGKEDTKKSKSFTKKFIVDNEGKIYVGLDYINKTAVVTVSGK